MSKKKVAFICVHNSCRSQIAEALGHYLASDVFESYSAGTETKPVINQDAVRIMKQMYGIDMEEAQYSKLIIEISYIQRDLITVIFYYQISLKPLKTLSLSQVSFPLLFPLYYIVP